MTSATHDATAAWLYRRFGLRETGKILYGDTSESFFKKKKYGHTAVLVKLLFN